MSTENHGENPGLVAQPHGGALRVGGTNKGGTGRPPNRVRELAKLAVEDSLPIIAEMVKGGENVYPSQQIQAFKVLADIGLPKEVIQTVLTQDSAAIMEYVAMAAAEIMDDAQLEAFLKRIEELARGGPSGSDPELPDAGA